MHGPIDDRRASLSHLVWRTGTRTDRIRRRACMHAHAPVVPYRVGVWGRGGRCSARVGARSAAPLPSAKNAGGRAGGQWCGGLRW
jgi:hypothetical protein